MQLLKFRQLLLAVCFLLPEPIFARDSAEFKVWPGLHTGRLKRWMVPAEGRKQRRVIFSSCGCKPSGAWAMGQNLALQNFASDLIATRRLCRRLSQSKAVGIPTPCGMSPATSICTTRRDTRNGRELRFRLKSSCSVAAGALCKSWEAQAANYL